jgi:hypothetical protein
MLCSAPAHFGKEIHQLALQEEFKFLSEENDITIWLIEEDTRVHSF